MTITEQLNDRYAKGEFAVICSAYRTIPVRDRSMIREAKGGVEIRTGKRWTFAFSHQVKFARNA
jgi:hypothetical protein